MGLLKRFKCNPIHPDSFVFYSLSLAHSQTDCSLPPSSTVQTVPGQPPILSLLGSSCYISVPT